MTADYRVQAAEDPSAVVRELHRTHTASEDFHRFVAEHFSKLFETPAAFKRVRVLYGHATVTRS